MLLNIHESFLLMVESGICLTLWTMTLIQLRPLRVKCSVRMRENTDQKKNPYLDTFHAVDLFLKMFIFWLFIYFCLFNYVIIHKSNHHRCSMKKVSQNSQESTCARFSFLIKLHASGNDFD